jgi:hypothetical protein
MMAGRGDTGGLSVNGEQLELQKAIDQTVTRLQDEFGERLSVDTIVQCVNASLDEFSDARVKTYVPVLTYRLAREQLGRLVDAPN